MTRSPINFAEKLAKFSEHWSPRVVAEMNDYQFKLVKVQGEFVWHQHDDTDETFIVLDGELEIAFRDGPVFLPGRCTSCRKASSTSRVPLEKPTCSSSSLGVSSIRAMRAAT